MTTIPTIALGDARVGFRGRITALDLARAPAAGLPPPELERRLIELGFVEGATVELLHQGAVRRRSDRRSRGRHDDRAATPRGHGRDGDGPVVNAVVELAPVVALVGNPNCGKTALFNALTGSRQKVANYPGVTVEKKVGRLTTPAGRSIEIVDLPGTYSLRARSPGRGDHARRGAGPARDRARARPDRLRRRRLQPAPGAAPRPRAEAGRPAGDAVAQHDDIARKRASRSTWTALARELGCPVVSSVAVRRGGIDALLAALDTRLAADQATSTSDVARARRHRHARRPARGRPRAARGDPPGRATSIPARRRPTPCCCIRSAGW